VSDDAVREIGIEAVLQEGIGAFMLYYERVTGEDGLGGPWTGAELHTSEVGGDSGGIEEQAQTQEIHQVEVEMDDAAKHRSEEEQEKVEQEVIVAVMPPPAVIKARVVRSVSLGPDEVLGGTSVKPEAQAEVDPELSPSESFFEVDQPVPTVAAPAVELPLATPAKAPSPIPDPPVVDDPRISFPRTVDLRA